MPFENGSVTQSWPAVRTDLRVRDVCPHRRCDGPLVGQVDAILRREPHEECPSPAGFETNPALTGVPHPTPR